ncbi:MAG: succinylglutamate desuccinylase/aspartoacylase family protein [Acidobacteria bacterium]|nr:succinylglutamate desuccinylase/aspartoacylase family protein [Acidobacteriota bacterium]MBI3663054.1 succinylglutamate desuccinylase/aspartoacylase family protein [Acidobacteriota bacterium]
MICRNLRIAAFVLALSLLLPAASFAQRASFSVGPLAAAPGTRASGFLEVPARGADQGTRIPVTVIHGAKAGPVLGLVAGTHGYEYAPIVAMQRFPAKVDPQELAGTIIIVHVANMPSFLSRTIYYSPTDGKNLNRVYPGKADGTLSERIADAITREVIEKSDYVADLHCGDGNEALRPYSYWMTNGTPTVNAKSKEMVLAFGLDHIVIDNERSGDPAKSVYTANTAITRGKPAITTETGGMGQVDAEGVDLAEAGAFNLLRHFKMLGGEPKRAEHPIWIDRNEVLRAPETGTFHARVKPGLTVAQGSILGVLTDFFGKTIQEVRAPFSGVILYVVATPPVNQGEPLAMVGHLKMPE